MKFLGSLIVFVVVAFAVKAVYPKLFAEKEKYPPPPGVAAGSKEHLKHIAAQMKAQLPRQLDSETLFTDVYAREGEMVYTGKLVNYRAQDLDGGKFRDFAQGHLKKKICADRDVKRLWQKHDITFSYQFIGKDGFSLGMLSVGPSDC